MAKQKRSPAAPSFGLAAAIERVRRLYGELHEHSAPLEAIASSLSLSLKSSVFAQLIATLKQFGLLEGGESDGEFKLTGTALDILVHPKGSDGWRKAVQNAALHPTIHNELWKRFDGLIPGDEVLRVYLLRQRETTFHPDQVVGFIRQFRETLEFAQINDSTTIGSDALDEIEQQTVVPGDLIQWDSGGSERFPKPRRVRKVADGGDWIFVDDSETGIPASEIRLIERGKPPMQTQNDGLPPTDPLPSRQVVRRESIMLEEGPLVVEWPGNIGKASVEDIEQWSQLFLKRLKRAVGL